MQFEIDALTPAGDVASLMMEASNASDAQSQVAVRGYTVLKTRSKANAAALFAFSPSFPLLLFTQELVTLLDAGLTLIEALRTLCKKEPRSDVQRILEAVIAGLSEGLPLSQTLERYPGAFSKLYIETVRAGERTGDVARGLSRFVAYQLQMDSLKRKVLMASIYPALVVFVGCLVIGFLAIYVIPKFSHIYAELGRNMPLSARLLVGFGQFVDQHGRGLAVTAIVLIFAMVMLLRDHRIREGLVDQLWRIPRLGARLRLYQLARFYRTMGMLVAGGTPFVPALDQASGLLPRTLSARLDAARQLIQQGRPVSFALAQHGLTTPVADSLLLVAERSGQAGEMLERIAQFYDEDLGRWIDRFARLFEPILMLAIGILVGVVVVLMYQPIFELASGIQ